MRHDPSTAVLAAISRIGKHGPSQMAICVAIEFATFGGAIASLQPSSLVGHFFKLTDPVLKEGSGCIGFKSLGHFNLRECPEFQQFEIGCGKRPHLQSRQSPSYLPTFLSFLTLRWYELVRRTCKTGRPEPYSIGCGNKQMAQIYLLPPTSEHV